MFRDHSTDIVTDQLNQPIYRVAGYGESVGLTILVDPEINDYVSFRSSFFGIKVLIHGAEEFPDSSVTTIIAQPGNDVSIAVVPTVVVSNIEIRSLPVNQRDCLFEDEVSVRLEGMFCCFVYAKTILYLQKKLRTTDRYSYESCLTECVVDAILNICGCIPFFYPHLRKFWN